MPIGSGGSAQGDSTDEFTAIFLVAGDTAEVIDRARGRSDLEILVADTEIDLLKQLRDHPNAVCVVPLPLPNFNIESFLDQVNARSSTASVVAIGESDDAPPEVITLQTPIDPDRLSLRVRQVAGEHRLEKWRDRHDRVSSLVLSTILDLAETDDISEVEGVIYDRISRSTLYQFVLVGRFDLQENTLTTAYPITTDIDVDDPSTIPGMTQSAVVSEAIETRTVTTIETAEFTRSTASRSSTPSTATTAGTSTFVVVPVTYAGQVFGVVILSVDAATVDDAERELLERFGRVTGSIWATNESTNRQQVIDGTDRQVLDVLLHELRNPLQIAIQYLELGRKRDDAEALERVAAAHERIESILSRGADLLPVETIEERDRVDIGAAAKRAWDSVETDEAWLTVYESPRVIADPDLLHHLLVNLFDNAVEHGGEDVEVRVGPLPFDAGFYVEDSGPGFPEENRDDLFAWGVSTTSDGLGIGLGLVREISMAHEWELRTTESSDGGARFEIRTTSQSSRGADSGDNLADLFSEWEAKEQSACVPD